LPYTVLLLTLSLTATKAKYQPVKEVTLELLNETPKEVKPLKTLTWQKSLAVFILYVLIFGSLLLLRPTMAISVYYLNIPLFSYTILGTLLASYTDTKYAVISNYFTYGGTLLAIVTALMMFSVDTFRASLTLVGGGILTLVIFLLFILLRGKIGGGDLKYILMTAFILPITSIPYFLLLACLFMLIGYILRAIKCRRLNFDKPMQFGIPLSLAMLIELLAYLIFVNGITL
jgi:Flp pilus assembly protein protease CpaA